MSDNEVPPTPPRSSGRSQFSLYAGLEFSGFHDVQDAIEEAREDGYDFIAVPLATPPSPAMLELVKEADKESAGGEEAVEYLYEPYVGSDLKLNSDQWNSLIVGRVSPWIRMDAKNARLRELSEKAFMSELSWSSHVSLPAVLLPSPCEQEGSQSVRMRVCNYARHLLAHVTKSGYTQMWVEFPWCSPEGGIDQWDVWNSLRSLCDYSSMISPALRLTADVPDTEELERWLGEPVKVVVLDTSIFLTNESGFPVLSKAHQRMIQSKFSRMNVQYVIRGESSLGGGKDYQLYWQYLGWLYKTIPTMEQQEQFEHPFNDYLQSPLQPLMDNLHSGTYEVFEKDPIKYRQYEEAVYQALVDRKKVHTVLMVVGAGRGPLVRASIRAAAKAEHSDLKIYAVEKNPNAVITLRAMKKNLEWENVTVVDSDMRVWEAPEKADILVSELLGSFGDNELSPECLDGAQKFLKKDGISIPAEYTSFIAPVSTHRLWSQVNASASTARDPMKHFETSYVVKLVNGQVLAPAQKVFFFEHPKFDQKIDNNRFTQLTFTAGATQTMHGFVGYFDSKLYADVYISINPETFSEGMFSWFPIYFPLATPFSVKKGDTIEFSMWRVVGGGKVWYEWCVTAPELTALHNPSGRSHWIGL